MAQLMNIEELAAYLKLEKQTIYNWLHEKKISGIKIGHVWRFDKDAIDKWLTSRTVNARSNISMGKKNAARKAKRVK
ncbi:MAG: helix-turn-helix domain-containing protein [Candidatus Omnitrophica bacterium]|nr:helix-turn-helix domain-containing protein [Candidatus Omnitrophota bacterium]